MKTILLLALLAFTVCEQDKKVWDAIMGACGNKKGTAALMGNLFAESGIRFVIYENAYKKKIGLSDAEYVRKVNDGSYTNFVKDAVGFGLAQWTYYTRKQGLLNMCRGKIGDADCQIKYLIHEITQVMPQVGKKMKDCQNIRTCSDYILKVFENPADQSESVKQKRASYGEDFYKRYA